MGFKVRHINTGSYVTITSLSLLRNTIRHNLSDNLSEFEYIIQESPNKRHNLNHPLVFRNEQEANRFIEIIIPYMSNFENSAFIITPETEDLFESSINYEFY